MSRLAKRVKTLSERSALLNSSTARNEAYQQALKEVEAKKALLRKEINEEVRTFNKLVGNALVVEQNFPNPNGRWIRINTGFVLYHTQTKEKLLKRYMLGTEEFGNGIAMFTAPYWPQQSDHVFLWLAADNTYAFLPNVRNIVKGPRE